jgi:hypothetical protein
MRGLVPSIANLGERFANAAKPGGELKLWDLTTGREVSTLRRGIRPIGALASASVIVALPTSVSRPVLENRDKRG